MSPIRTFFRPLLLHHLYKFLISSSLQISNFIISTNFLFHHLLVETHFMFTYPCANGMVWVQTWWALICIVDLKLKDFTGSLYVLVSSIILAHLQKLWFFEFCRYSRVSNKNDACSKSFLLSCALEKLPKIDFHRKCHSSLTLKVNSTVLRALYSK